MFELPFTEVIKIRIKPLKLLRYHQNNIVLKYLILLMVFAI